MKTYDMPLVDRLLWHACHSKQTEHRAWSEVIKAAEFFFTPDEVENARRRAGGIYEDRSDEEVKP